MIEFYSCKKFYLFLIILIIIFFTNLNFVFASYVANVYFNVPDPVYKTNERIELKGWVYLMNLTGNNVSSLLTNANVNLTIRNSSGNYVNSYNFTTDANGTFYSRSNYYTNATEINASSTAGSYAIRAEYKDPENVTWFSEVWINVVNQTIDLLRVSSQKAIYNPSELVKVEAEAIKIIGDSILYVSNVSINGSLRNSSKGLIQAFSCMTGSNGKCSVYITAPSSYGNYILELENFKVYNPFSVVPFSYNLYMKDELGKSLKNVFALGEQARVEVRISNASTSDVYTFSGYMANSSGSVIKTITSTTLNNNNSFTNSFLFTIDALTFRYGAYGVYVNVTKIGDGSITSLTSFKVEDWVLSVNKKSVNSGFEYEYSSFKNKTLRFEAIPSYRSNGTIIPNISSSYFEVNLKDNLNNIIASSNNTVWNSSCGANGCYEFSITSPLNTGKYTLYIALSNGGSRQTESRVINIIDGVMSGQSTDKDGNTKELFGTNEYAYLSLNTYNSTSSGFNLTDAEIFIVSYMNGSEFSYTNVSNFEQVNSSNSNYEWAWNSTAQRIKLDVPKTGGVYNVFVFGNNRTIGTIVKFIVNPYDVCSSAKNTPGTVSSGYYYVWQFKTTDTIYFELKLTQANNPLGKASVMNSSSNGSSTYGMGGSCNINTATKQVVSNATITVLEVKNLESGAIQNLNSTESTCQASDSSGGYSCTVKPLSKWEGGQNIVKFNIAGQDGTTSIAYSRFEARAFYLYGWTSNYQNNPSSNITLSIRIYEAGSNWWSSYGSSGGLSGTVTLKKIEYQGRDGEWIWPPVDSGYNASRVNSSAITTGVGNISIPVEYSVNGTWKTGYYRALLQATTSSGDSDYGYAWFSVKLWDVYGSPVECLSTACNYKSYFNSRENITLYIRINKAGNWDNGGQNIWGNTSISVKKIQDCRKWPCKDLNSSQYISNTIYVNTSSPWYWNTNLTSSSNYLIYINSTTGTWGTGYYNVVLNVNGTDTGYAWFNTIAFYVETQPVNSSRSYKYSIRGNVPMYFNVSTTKNYKWQSSYWNGSEYIYNRYNSSDYVNVTFDDAVLRAWDQQTWQSKEYNYPEDINVTPRSINGTGVVNITFNNVTWPNGYYWGELSLKNSDNETSTGWLWFNVQPFRVQVNTFGNTYNMDIDQCVNTTLYIYDPDWNLNTLLAGNYSITSVYEDIWSYSGSSRTIYTNYSNVSFNATGNITLCPNVTWSSGSWGGYHYLNIIVRDNVQNDSQSGWLSFRALPFQVSWSGTSSNVRTNQAISALASLTTSTGANATGNLTRFYQWRYDNGMSQIEEYVFKVGNCYSNVSGNCLVNGTNVNVTIYPPSGGWKIGYNYIYSGWVKSNDASTIVQDNYGIYFDGRAAYNGYFDNSALNGNYKYYFSPDENITIKLYVRNSDYSAADSVSITSVSYAYSENCWDENCRSYTSTTFSPTTTNAQGIAILDIQKPSGGWTRGLYAIKAVVGGASITGGTLRVKNMTAPNITIISPVNNGTYGNSFYFNATTTKNSQCSISIINYNNFHSWGYCSGWNATNSSNSTSLREACNTTKYNYNGSSYLNNYVSSNYYSMDYGSNNYSYYSGPTGFVTGGATHIYNINTTNFTDQAYGMSVWCSDDDYNYVNEKVAFRINKTS